MSSLVIQTSFIGDVILTTPLIAKLAERGVVDVVTTPIGATVLQDNPHIRHVIVYDKRGTDAGIRGFRATARRIRSAIRRLPSAESQTTAYFAQGSLRSAALAVAAGVQTRVGFATSGGKRLYTSLVTYRDDWHHARRLLSLADYAYAEAVDDTTVGGTTALTATSTARARTSLPLSLQPRVYPSATDCAAVDALLEGRSKPFVVLAPGSVWATKRWPYYVELAERLSQQVPHGWDIAIVGSAADRDSAQSIIQRIGVERSIDAVGKLSLLGSAELIRRGRVIVTNDSAPQHLASAVGTPTVTVFGPTVPGFGFGPLAAGSHVVERQSLACRPCDKHGPQQCPLGHWKCMREIEVSNVYDTVKAMEGGT